MKRIKKREEDVHIENKKIFWDQSKLVNKELRDIHVKVSEFHDMYPKLKDWKQQVMFAFRVTCWETFKRIYWDDWEKTKNKTYKD